MLYVTTRSNQDAFTPQRVLCDNRASDGGLYVPFQEPQFSDEIIAELMERSFGECVACVLNKLFRTRLSSWDIELAAGRYFVRLKKIGQRTIVAECWHNLESDFQQVCRNLTKLLRSDKNCANEPGDWTVIAIRVAVLFGIFSELMRAGVAGKEIPVDVSVVSGDFSVPMSVWYARKWGLPVGNVVCCCNENGTLWDFICHGQLRTDGVAKKTVIPDADVVIPVSLERLIYYYGGTEEVNRYLEAVRRGVSYYMDDKMLHSLREGIFVSVNSERRILSTIPAVYATRKYLLSPYEALAYSGLQDYRSRKKENKMALIFAEKSPTHNIESIAAAMGVSEKEIRKLMD